MSVKRPLSTHVKVVLKSVEIRMSNVKYEISYANKMKADKLRKMRYQIRSTGINAYKTRFFRSQKFRV
jgi:hypothetical protein